MNAESSYRPTGARPALEPRTALLLALEFTLLTLLAGRAGSLAALALLAGLYGFSAGSARARLLLLLLVVAGSWTVIISQAMFYPGPDRTLLLRLVPPGWFPFGEGGLALYREGFGYGLVQSLRFDVMLLLGAGLVSRYSPDELTRALRGLGLPGALGFMLAVAMRYLPLQAAEFRAARRGLRLRGLGGGLRFIRPVLAANVRRADEIAMALKARGFSTQALAGSGTGSGTGSRAGGMTAAARSALAAGGALILLLAGVRLLGQWRLLSGGEGGLTGLLGQIMRWVEIHV